MWWRTCLKLSEKKRRGPSWNLKIKPTFFSFFFFVFFVFLVSVWLVMVLKFVEGLIRGVGKERVKDEGIVLERVRDCDWRRYGFGIKSYLLRWEVFCWHRISASSNSVALSLYSSVTEYGTVFVIDNSNFQDWESAYSTIDL